MNTIESPKRLSHRTRMRGAILGASLALALVAAAPASADFPCDAPEFCADFDGTVTQQDGSPASQAGSHPFEATTDIDFTTQPSGLPTEMPRTIIVDLPAGLIGNPNAVPLCTRAEFFDGSLGGIGCPPESQVGTSTLKTTFGPQKFAVYAFTPKPGEPARFVFRALIPPVYIDARVRTESDYGLTVTIRGISEALPLTGTSLTFWGVPADPAHDAERTCPGFVSPCASHAPRKAFLTNPTSCTGPVTTTMHADSWQHPGDFKTASFVTHDQFGNPIGATGCDLERFSPSVSVTPSVNSADSPSGLSVNLHVPQNDNADGLETAHLKKAVVTLPAGVSVNPSAADGLGSCSPAQIGLGTADAPTCPDSSKVGTVQVVTPLLKDPMEGSIYLAQQGNNPFGSLLAIYIVAQRDGVLLKLPGNVEADPSTGQLKTTIDNSPQLPFSDFNLTFDGGPRGALATPASCGSFTTTSDLTPWSGGPPAAPSSSFAISNDCGGGFSPSMLAGSTSTGARQATGFTLQVKRGDGQQHIESLSATLPPGLLAKVGSVPLCDDAAAAAGTCDASSQIGTTSVGTGAGSQPFYLPGRVYLTGPYKGAPFGLSIVVPAVAGPFNLGTVVVRAAIAVDPNDAHLTITSDDLPSMLQGIPLRLRSIAVDINKAGFMTNPTSCTPMNRDRPGLLAGRLHGGGLEPVPGRWLRPAAVQPVAFGEADRRPREHQEEQEPGPGRDRQVRFRSGEPAQCRTDTAQDAGDQARWNGVHAGSVRPECLPRLEPGRHRQGGDAALVKPADWPGVPGEPAGRRRAGAVREADGLGVDNQPAEPDTDQERRAQGDVRGNSGRLDLPVPAFAEERQGRIADNERQRLLQLALGGGDARRPEWPALAQGAGRLGDTRQGEQVQEGTEAKPDTSITPARATPSICRAGQ